MASTAPPPGHAPVRGSLLLIPCSPSPGPGFCASFHKRRQLEAAPVCDHAPLGFDRAPLGCDRAPLGCDRGVELTVTEQDIQQGVLVQPPYLILPVCECVVTAAHLHRCQTGELPPTNRQLLESARASNYLHPTDCKFPKFAFNGVFEPVHMI